MYVIIPSPLLEKHPPRPWWKWLFLFWMPRSAMAVMYPNSTIRVHPSNLDTLRRALETKQLPYRVAGASLGVAK